MSRRAMRAGIGELNPSNTAQFRRQGAARRRCLRAAMAFRRGTA